MIGSPQVSELGLLMVLASLNFCSFASHICANHANRIVAATVAKKARNMVSSMALFVMVRHSFKSGLLLPMLSRLAEEQVTCQLCVE
jgi:hypothetical protein